jgi:L-lactate dehydrogenase complex protein LldE
MQAVSGKRLVGHEVQLMGTCLCDAFFDDAAMASVAVLEHVGVTVRFPEGQTCCGQPAFNAGDWDASRRVARHGFTVFAADKPVIIPSGSCAAMVGHGNQLQFADQPDAAAARAMAAKTWELTDFLVNGLGITRWPGRYPAKVALHRSCHTRGTDCYPAAVQLLQSIDGLQLLEVGELEQCCGFGGTFSVSFPHVSAEMGQLKVEHLTAGQPDVIASLDMACALHFGGMMDRAGIPIPRLHVAQILRDALLEKRPDKA